MRRGQKKRANPEQRVMQTMSYEKAVRCLPSFLSHLVHGRPTLMDLQAGVIVYGMKVLWIPFAGWNKHYDALPDLPTGQEGRRKVEQLVRWLEMTGGVTRVKR